VGGGGWVGVGGGGGGGGGLGGFSLPRSGLINNIATPTRGRVLTFQFTGTRLSRSATDRRKSGGSFQILDVFWSESGGESSESKVIPLRSSPGVP